MSLPFELELRDTRGDLAKTGSVRAWVLARHFLVDELEGALHGVEHDFGYEDPLTHCPKDADSSSLRPIRREFPHTLGLRSRCQPQPYRAPPATAKKPPPHRPHSRRPDSR